MVNIGMANPSRREGLGVVEFKQTTSSIGSDPGCRVFGSLGAFLCFLP
jgi:hypothetical protein